MTSGCRWAYSEHASANSLLRGCVQKLHACMHACMHALLSEYIAPMKHFWCEITRVVRKDRAQMCTVHALSIGFPFRNVRFDISKRDVEHTVGWTCFCVGLRTTDRPRPSATSGCRWALRGRVLCVERTSDTPRSC